jgi:hypothetical protein
MSSTRTRLTRWLIAVATVVSLGCASPAQREGEAIRGRVMRKLDAMPCGRVFVVLRAIDGSTLKPVEYDAWFKLPETLERVTWQRDVMQAVESTRGLLIRHRDGPPGTPARTSPVTVREMLLASLGSVPKLEVVGRCNLASREATILSATSGESRWTYWVDESSLELLGAVTDWPGRGGACYAYFGWDDCEPSELETVGSLESIAAATQRRAAWTQAGESFCAAPPMGSP